jgi:methyl-accepting chemotaxis protein
LNEIKSELSELTRVIKKEIKDTEAFVTRGIDVMHTEAGKAEFRNVLAVLTDEEHRYDELSLNSDRIMSITGMAELAGEAAKVEELQDALKHELIDLLEKIQKFTLAASLQAEHDEQTGIFWIIASFVLALIIGSILPYIISRSIIIPINNLSSRLAEIAIGDGDLTVRLNDKATDETGDVAREFNKFLDVLKTLISNTNTQADDLGEASELALKVMRETVSNIEKQHAETGMVATAVNEMSGSTQEVARSAAHASQVVKEKVTEGRQEAIETHSIIKQLAEVVSEASNVIKSLVEETNNIGSVLETIPGIAAQTNLLALNAAIEAARAGETGRGFAVVADEVRTLAQRTQTSTVDIQNLLLRLKTEANNAVTSMNKGTESAATCLEKSAKTSQTFEEASDSVTQISDLNVQIATAAEEQSAVAEEINRNIVRISDLADITAQGAKSTSEANATIAKRVIDLHTNLNVFVV